MRGWKTARGSAFLLVLFLFGCGAAYSGYMAGSLRRLEREDYEGALAKIEKPDGKTNRLLYNLERGLIFHYQGRYDESNAEFEKAERLIDQLFTRSISREVASLLTNDAIIAYGGEEFERALIHYYRALNYQYLGDGQAALVECRKANLKLEDYAASAEYKLDYRNDAFMQYTTGLFYEAQGEWNDAYISYRDAEKGYRAYQEAFGISMPRMLVRDLAQLARRLGYEDDLEEYRQRYRLRPEEEEAPGGGELIVFAEHGFVARKHQIELNVPILKGDDAGQVWVVSEQVVYRYHHPHAYPSYQLDYWLRVALPEYREVPSQVAGVRVRGGGESTTAVLVEDISAIAQKNFAQKFDTILLRTAARALAKYMAARGVEKAFEEDGDKEEDVYDQAVREGLGKFLGVLVNLFGAATEAADTRSWLSLPSGIRLARLPVQPGTVEPVLEFLNGRGEVLETRSLAPVEVGEGAKVFVNVRTYR